MVVIMVQKHYHVASFCIGVEKCLCFFFWWMEVAFRAVAKLCRWSDTRVAKKSPLTTTINLFFPFSSSNCHPGSNLEENFANCRRWIFGRIWKLQGEEEEVFFCWCFLERLLNGRDANEAKPRLLHYPTRLENKLHALCLASCELLALLGSRPQDSWSSPAWHMAFPILPKQALFNFLILSSVPRMAFTSLISLCGMSSTSFLFSSPTCTALVLSFMARPMLHTT